MSKQTDEEIARDLAAEIFHDANGLNLADSFGYCDDPDGDIENWTIDGDVNLIAIVAFVRGKVQG